jgi:hypothetical protein
MSREMIYILNPYSADEIRAKRYCLLINNDIEPQNMFTPDMDLPTYWIYVSETKNNDIKRKALKIIEDMMIEQ